MASREKDYEEEWKGFHYDLVKPRKGLFPVERNDLVLVKWEKETSLVYILKENSLSTYFDSSSLDTDEIKKISVKELFAHDEKILQRNYPQMKRDFGEKRYAEGLFLSFVNEPFIKQVTLVVTNARKLESSVRKASNPRGNESVFILYPFEEIATRYISLDFRSLDCVVLNRYSLERYNESEWCDFLYHFQRYIKFFCDCDILSISEEDSEK